MKDGFQFSNIGYVIADVDPYVVSLLTKEANTIKDDFEHSQKYNHNLAGNIKKEFDLTDIKQTVEPYILNVCKYHRESFPQYKPRFVSKNPIVLKDLWINFQKKNEFNPVHNHTGLYSFVIWLDIPYNIEDELTQGPGADSNNNLAGHFEFTYSNTLGEFATLPIPADKQYNGKICLFPSAMPHAVYPFYTSDDYRITVSGNVNFSD